MCGNGKLRKIGVLSLQLKHSSLSFKFITNPFGCTTREYYSGDKDRLPKLCLLSITSHAGIQQI